MFITSMGIFGYLSKAHIEQTTAGQENMAQVERVESEIARYEEIIVRAENKIKKLESSGTGADANIQAQIDKEQKRIEDAYKRIQPAIDEQQAIIDSQSQLWLKELNKIDQQMETLQGYIDNGETKKAQQMIGASADGIFGKKTADRIGDWQEKKNKERLELLEKIEEASNNPQAKAARDEITRLRKTAETQIAQSNLLIDRLRKQLGNEDKAADVDTEVDELNTKIKEANAEIDTLIDQKYKMQGEYRKLEAEVGPIKYIAEFIYGEDADTNLLEAAVRWVIIIIIFVFDPLAVLLLIASQYTFGWYRKNKPKKKDDFDFEEYEKLRSQKIADNPGPDLNDKQNIAEEDKDEEENYSTESKDTTQEDPEAPSEGQNIESSGREERNVEPLVETKEEERQADEEQLDLFDDKHDVGPQREDETREEYHKRIWKNEHPGKTIQLQKQLKDKGIIENLPWEEVDDTIEDMKDKGEWPDAKEEQDLDKWNDWVEKANEEAEKNPEGKAQYTEVIEPTGFVQNEEQKTESVFKKINEARTKIDFDGLKKLEISEEQYRDASKAKLVNTIQRLKDGLITIDDLTASEKNEIEKLIEEDNSGSKN